MKDAHTTDIHVVRLLENVGFLRYVLEGDENEAMYWLQYETQHPQYKEAMEQARQILQQLDRPTRFLTADELENLKIHIKNSLGV